MADDPTAAAPAAPASEPAPPESRLWAAIKRWRDTQIAGGPIARATECWNHLEATLEHLATSILREF